MIPFQLQFITNPMQGFPPAKQAEMVLRGGCRWVQLRMKEADPSEVEAEARDICRLCRDCGATFIVDDYPAMAASVGADGVHLGRNDMPVAEARRLLGPGFTIGGTANTMDDIRRLALDGADYIGCGPLRFTTTKRNLAPRLGFEGYRHILRGIKRENIGLPLVAIGGITLTDLPPFFAAGVEAVAVSGSILGSPDPAGYVRQLIAAIDRLSAERQEPSNTTITI